MLCFEWLLLPFNKSVCYKVRRWSVVLQVEVFHTQLASARRAAGCCVWVSCCAALSYVSFWVVQLVAQDLKCQIAASAKGSGFDNCKELGGKWAAPALRGCFQQDTAMLSKHLEDVSLLPFSPLPAFCAHNSSDPQLLLTQGRWHWCSLGLPFGVAVFWPWLTSGCKATLELICVLVCRDTLRGLYLTLISTNSL